MSTMPVKPDCTCGAPPDSIHEPICDLMRDLDATPAVETNSDGQYRVEVGNDGLLVVGPGDEQWDCSEEDGIESLVDRLNSLAAKPADSDELSHTQREELLEEGYRQGWDAHIEHLEREPKPTDSGLRAPNAEALGREVRETWIQWAKAQPDIADHPSWLVPWDELPERDKQVDRFIGIAVVNAYLAASGEQVPADSGLRDALELLRAARRALGDDPYGVPMEIDAYFEKRAALDAHQGEVQS